MTNSINEFALVDKGTKSLIKLNEAVIFYCFIFKVINSFI